MSVRQFCLSLFRKYGPIAKGVVTAVLNVVAPGSGTLVEMTGQALDAASEVADKTARENWERELLARLDQSEAELARLGQMLEFLTGPLAAVCDKAAAFADQADDLPDIIGRAIAADPSLAQVLHQMEAVKEQFAVFQADIRRLADRQEEAAPVYVRMNRVADYFDELWHAGIKPKDFVRLLHDRTRAVACIEQGDTGELDNLFLEMRTTAPKAASIPLLEAAASVREFNYPAAQRALATALRLKPGDGELLELSRRVTILATLATPSQPRPTGPKRRLQPGDTLDGWRLEERLGAGGWGQVFKATRDGQTRALKVMHPDLAADRFFVERFKKEIAILLRLPRHPNLVRIEDFGYCQERRTWYLAMEYVDGPTLENYLAQKGPLTEAQVHQVFRDAIDGLAQAHAAGFVHRDIKPGNLIFRTSDQRLVFVDFGLSVEVQDIGHTRISGLARQFAAPEQHLGKPATQASDVFSLCAVIHYALHYDKPGLRTPNCFSPSLAPESLCEALTRGLAVNVDDRLADAGQLRQLFVPMATPAAPTRPQAPSADPVADFARWKQQVEERKAQAQRAADIVIEVPLSSSVKMKFAFVPPGTSWSRRAYFSGPEQVQLLLRQVEDRPDAGPDQRPFFHAGELRRQLPRRQGRQGAVPESHQRGGLVFAEPAGYLRSARQRVGVDLLPGRLVPGDPGRQLEQRRRQVRGVGPPQARAGLRLQPPRLPSARSSAGGRRPTQRNRPSSGSAARADKSKCERLGAGSFGERSGPASFPGHLLLEVVASLEIDEALGGMEPVESRLAVRRATTTPPAGSTTRPTSKRSGSTRRMIWACPACSTWPRPRRLSWRSAVPMPTRLCRASSAAARA